MPRYIKCLYSIKEYSSRRDVIIETEGDVARQSDTLKCRAETRTGLHTIGLFLQCAFLLFP
jgi:hypothetical protein